MLWCTVGRMTLGSGPMRIQEYALGHRRLSIQDLSSEGHQPMTSACKRFVMSYNGEIYNFTELRKQLEHQGFHFRGHSDTEVLLGAVTEWGLEKNP
jgi:asparagine synthase (glutamine-hydrolysing)